MRDLGIAIKSFSHVIVAGQPYVEMPDDLFIPPDALEVLLDSFNGPLDLLLYLIRKQNIDILDIPMTRITNQYMNYIALIEKQRIELAADYMAMAALLIEIKSKMLLPPSPKEDELEVEEDPRMALVRRLQIYEQFKKASEWLDAIPRCDREHFPVIKDCDHIDLTKSHPDVVMDDLVNAWRLLIENMAHQVSHQIHREPLSVRERMSLVLELLQSGLRVDFAKLYQRVEGEQGVIVSFLAILELAKQSMLKLSQTEPFGNISLMAKNHE
tara:strand:- start:125 stop:934 length:810 start_codon:yes stop_codon:yes gene_type:complete